MVSHQRFLDRCSITITGQNITIGVCHGTKFLQEMQFERCWRSASLPTPA